MPEAANASKRSPTAGPAIMSTVEIKYFSDILCVWAYISQARIDAIKEKFGDAVRIEQRFCSVFGDTATKIATAWKDKGGYAGFNAHLQEATAKFLHLDVHPSVWLNTRPASSMSAHLFLKAIQLGERDPATPEQRPGTFDAAMWAFRRAFFTECRDISHFDVQRAIAATLGADIGPSKRASIRARRLRHSPPTIRTPRSCASRAARASSSTKDGRSSTAMSASG
jgi:predicted DsbA family dithiol-disulfide isomerase